LSTDHAIAVLLLNGAVVFFVGMLVGIPYGLLRARQSNPEAQENWRVSHAQNLQNGFLLLIVGVCASHLDLSDLAMQAMVYLLVVAAYCDMAAWLIRPVTGHTGFLPAPPAANLAAFALFGITLLGQFAGIGLLIYGAWARYAAPGAV